MVSIKPFSSDTTYWNNPKAASYLREIAIFREDVCTSKSLKKINNNWILFHPNDFSKYFLFFFILGNKKLFSTLFYLDLHLKLGMLQVEKGKWQVHNFRFLIVNLQLSGTLLFKMQSFNYCKWSVIPWLPHSLLCISVTSF